MSSWSELLDHAESEEHLVQLYGDDDQLLTRNVTRYLAEGLKRGDGLVVIATKGHAESFNRQLNEECAAAPQALREGRLVFFDAQTTLDRFMVDGRPDQTLFRSVVTGILDEVHKRSPSGRIRAFGEMVGILWVSGEQSAAIKLEEFWNDLLAGSAVSLFCAYPIDLFNGTPQMGGLDAVLCAHSHMYAGPRTMLSGPRATR